ncbi:hypothetical protein Anas_03784 [Armadillidium nasatum]|uniref:Uncharacterized protein n=1 Tax=Armadillidium nasatum TaxID=96803 RepID=A0A5N5TPQ7_9CRUS|nr:hypothetical protein Anas_03784 [Armadillidium nasatum]
MFSILKNKFRLLNIMYLGLLLFCFINLSTEQHRSNEGNSTSFDLAASDVSDIIGNISTVPHETKKSKVRKRPGAPPIPEPSISDSGDVHDINSDNLKLKNSTVSPRKGAFNPPLVNDLSKLNDSFPVIDKCESSCSNQTVNNTEETISNINRTDTMAIKNSSISGVESTKEFNATGGKDNEPVSIYSIVTTAAAPIPTIHESTKNSSIIKENVTSSNTEENNLKKNSSLTTLPSELFNLTLSSKKPFTASAVDGNSKKTNAWTIVGAVLVVLILCSCVGFVAYKRLYAYWDRRHYSRMDFLIDGLI